MCKILCLPIVQRISFLINLCYLRLILLSNARTLSKAGCWIGFLDSCSCRAVVLSQRTVIISEMNCLVVGVTCFHSKASTALVTKVHQHKTEQEKGKNRGSC